QSNAEQSVVQVNIRLNRGRLADSRHRLSVSELLERKARQRTNGYAARTLGQIGPRLVGPRGPGDVDVRPRHAAVDELLEEHRRGDRPRGTSAGVHHVGDLALQLLAIFLEQR